MWCTLKYSEEFLNIEFKKSYQNYMYRYCLNKSFCVKFFLQLQYYRVQEDQKLQELEQRQKCMEQGDSSTAQCGEDGQEDDTDIQMDDHSVENVICADVVGFGVQYRIYTDQRLMLYIL